MPTIIHLPHPRFIQDGSFWIMFIHLGFVALVARSNEKLANVIINSEFTSYDRVDWEFLHSVLAHFGFSKEWIRGISSLYYSTQSRVLLAGIYGPFFLFLNQFAKVVPLLPSCYYFLLRQ